MAQKVLITGASFGIGEDLAHVFAADGYDLILVARTKKKLLDVKKEIEKKFRVKVKVLPADLTKKSDVIALRKKTGPVDILVNNAGFGLHGKFSSKDQKRNLDMIELNIKSLVTLTSQYLDDMVDKGRGRILQVGSIVGWMAGPHMATYVATKHFVNSFSQALNHELKGTGVSCTVLCPGATKTKFSETAGVKNTLIHDLSPSSRAVAQAGYNGLMSGKRVVIPGFLSKTLVFTSWIMPDCIGLPIMSVFQRFAK